MRELRQQKKDNRAAAKAAIIKEKADRKAARKAAALAKKLKVRSNCQIVFQSKMQVSFLIILFLLYNANFRKKILKRKDPLRKF